MVCPKGDCNSVYLTLILDLDSYFSSHRRMCLDETPLLDRYRLAMQQTPGERVHIAQTGGITVGVHFRKRCKLSCRRYSAR